MKNRRKSGTPEPDVAKKSVARPARAKPEKTEPKLAKARKAGSAKPEPKNASAVGEVQRCPVVALGGSAGGLRAFQSFFEAARTDSGAAYVVVPHLDPSRQSLMVDLISKYTSMPVSAVTRKVKFRPNRVYVIAPNRYLSINGDSLQPEKAVPKRGIRMAIDFFFRSLAETLEDRAVCVLMSGTGTDGTLGLQAVKGHGGLTIAQEPSSAEHDGMPQSAIRTGLVDFVLTPEDMPKAINSYLRSRHLNATSNSTAATDEHNLRSLLTMIRMRGHHDFRQYKQGTIKRRVLRRISIRQAPSLGAYLNVVRNDPEEIDRLFEDLLIGVTSFFREPEAFDELVEQVFPKLFRPDRDEPVRVWVPGCSTGEEAYTLAMLMHEAAAKHNCTASIQIFATDIDEKALHAARHGVYPESVAADVNSTRLRRWFNREDHSYRVSKQIRESVVFASQNVMHDPPFSKLDLISCRNLLIYLEHDVQQRIFSLFNFALTGSGYLLLGPSESLGKSEPLFSSVSKKWRLFKKQLSVTPDRVQLPSMDMPSTWKRGASGEHSPKDKPENLAQLTERELLRQFAPPAIVCNSQFSVMYFFGNTGRYLEIPTGSPTNDLLAIARRGLSTKIRTVVRAVLEGGEKLAVQRARMIDSDGVDWVELRARPLKQKVELGLCLLSFVQVPGDPETAATPTKLHPDASEEALIAQLEMELRTTQDELQGTIEELETSNEELKTTNEEAMSMNEELQSSNEELETSKEELQSLNEELTTVNSELNSKVSEVERANSDLANLLASTDIATLFVDEDCKIKRFTPAAKDLFRLIASDIDRNIGDIVHSFGDQLDIATEAERVIRTLQPVERDAMTNDGRWFIRRLIPYRTSTNRIAGAVVTFIDITRQKDAESAVRASDDAHRQLFDDTPSMYFRLDSDRKILQVNRFGAEQIGFAPDQMSSLNFVKLHDDEVEVIKALTTAVELAGNLHIWDSRLARNNGPSIWVRYSARVQAGSGHLLVIGNDITNEKRLRDEVAYHASHDAMTGLFNRRQFDVMLERVIDGVRDNNSTHAMLFVDLDGFKAINDKHGHLAGDELLRQVSTMIRSHSRRRDVAARLGGDEFGILMEYCSPTDARRVANEVLAAIEGLEFTWGEQVLRIACSVGITAINSNSGDIEEVLHQADSACYRAKQAGGGCSHLYAESDGTSLHVLEPKGYGSRVSSAINTGKIELVGLPIYPLQGEAGGKPAGIEVLVRIADGEGGYLETERAVHVAERSGDIVQLDKLVLARALELLLSSNAFDSDSVWFSINVSAISLLRDEYLSAVEALVGQRGVNPGRISFELTESAAVLDLPRTVIALTRLRELGCKVALDDFGKGFSSFVHLDELPVNTLKIDGYFTRNLRAGKGANMIRAIAEVAASQGMTTVAEWVEDEATASTLKALHVDYAQGYWCGEPRPLAELLAAL